MSNWNTIGLSGIFMHLIKHKGSVLISGMVLLTFVLFFNWVVPLIVLLILSHSMRIHTKNEVAYHRMYGGRNITFKYWDFILYRLSDRCVKTSWVLVVANNGTKVQDFISCFCSGLIMIVRNTNNANKLLTLN